MHYKSSSNLTKLYTVVINCSAGHCFNILDNTSTPSSLEKHFSQSQPKSFHRLLSLDADSEQLGPTQPPGRRAPPPWQLAMPALDSSLPATISTIAASLPQHHLPPCCPSPAQLTLSCHGARQLAILRTQLRKACQCHLCWQGMASTASITLL